MNHRKVVGILFACFILNICLVNLVSAYGTIDLRQGSEQAIEWIADFSSPFIQVVLGGEDNSGLLLFERFLLFIILLSLVFVSLKNISLFEDQPAVLWVVSIIVPILSVRFMNFDWINFILTQYEVLGIVLAGILPFIIYLVFLHYLSDSSVVRRIGWAFFILVYFGLWSTSAVGYQEIYFWVMLVALAFLLFDEIIHKIFESQKYKDAQRSAIYRRIAEIDKDLSTIEKSAIDPRRKNKEILRLMRERKNMAKKL